MQSKGPHPQTHAQSITYKSPQPQTHARSKGPHPQMHAQSITYKSPQPQTHARSKGPHPQTHAQSITYKGPHPQTHAQSITYKGPQPPGLVLLCRKSPSVQFEVNQNPWFSIKPIHKSSLLARVEFNYMEKFVYQQNSEQAFDSTYSFIGRMHFFLLNFTVSNF